MPEKLISAHCLIPAELFVERNSQERFLENPAKILDRTVLYCF